MVKTKNEKIEFRIPGDELAAFRQRISDEGMTISLFLRMSIEQFMRTPRHNVSQKGETHIPFLGCLKGETGDYRDRAAAYVLGRRS